MGSKTIDLEIAVLHKTIKTPQQYFHKESLLAAMAKPLPSSRSWRRRNEVRAGNPNPPGRHGGDRRQLLGAPISSSSGRRAGALSAGALRAQGRRARAGRGGAAGSGLRGAAPDAAWTAGSRAAAPGAGRRKAGRARGRGHKGGRRRGGGRGARAGPPRTIDPGPGSGPDARTPLRRRSMSGRCAGRERRGAPPGARGPPQSSLIPTRGARQERGLGPRHGAKCARGWEVRGPFVRGEGAGTSSAPLPLSGRRRRPRRAGVRSAGALSERYKRGAPPRRAADGPPRGLVCRLDDWTVRQPPPRPPPQSGRCHLTGEPRPRPGRAARAQPRRGAGTKGPTRAQALAPPGGGLETLGPEGEEGAKGSAGHLSPRPAARRLRPEAPSSRDLRAQQTPKVRQRHHGKGAPFPLRRGKWWVSRVVEFLPPYEARTSPHPQICVEGSRPLAHPYPPLSKGLSVTLRT